MNLQELLGKQFLIASMIEQKLQVVNFLLETASSNKSISIHNPFYNLSAQMTYRTVALDLYALFGPYSSNNKYSLQRILSYSRDIKPRAKAYLKEKLEAKKDLVDKIKLLRHKQVAHYDFEYQSSVSHNYKEISTMNELFDLSKEMIQLIGCSFKDESIDMGYDFGRIHSPLRSLSKIN